MANLVRSAKSGSDWTRNDLDAYNIKRQQEDAATFFGNHNLPPPTVDEELMTTQNAEDMVFDHNVELINLLDLAMSSLSAKESAVNGFVVELFRRLGYVKRHRVTRTRKDIPYLICGKVRYARTDICLVNCQRNDILLVVQEDRHLPDDGIRVEAYPLLIVQAIAAFDYNNNLRVEAGEKPLESKVMAGITFLGTVPIFYKIPVTADLVRNMSYGTYPSEPITVSSHVPALPRPSHRYSKGMKPVDNRQAILRCYEAFKSIVGI